MSIKRRGVYKICMRLKFATEMTAVFILRGTLDDSAVYLRYKLTGIVEGIRISLNPQIAKHCGIVQESVINSALVKDRSTIGA